LHQPLKVILIGGTSHAGKSTLARELAERLGWEVISTDSLARHPGRPWAPEGQAVRPHVAEHYLTLEVDELIASVLAHYRGMWPMIRTLIEGRVSDPAASPLVLEGSALWPEQVADLGLDGVGAVWLTARDTLCEARIHAESAYHATEGDRRVMIEKFVARTKRYNELMMRHVKRLRLKSVDVEAEEDPAGACLRAVGARVARM
jgi:2-phosphoglycerate kinase